MKLRLFIFMLCACFSLSLYAQKKKKGEEEVQYKYELEASRDLARSNKYCIVKVWSYGKKEDDTRMMCMRNAVHGMIFKGYAGSGADKGRRPLCPEGYDAHKEYFDNFFKGDYMQYVQLTNNGAIAPGDMIKVAKKEYKVGMLVTVNIDELRRRLENDNVIKKLGSIF